MRDFKSINERSLLEYALYPLREVVCQKVSVIEQVALRRFREMIQVCFPKLTLGKLQLVRRQRPSRQVVGCRVVCTTMRSACL